MGFAVCLSLQWGTCLWIWKAIPFVGENGLQYLFGFVVLECGRMNTKRNYRTGREEGILVAGDEIMRRQRANPKMLCTTSGPTSAGVEALDGNDATREDEIRRLAARRG